MQYVSVVYIFCLEYGQSEKTYNVNQCKKSEESTKYSFIEYTCTCMKQ